VVELMSYGLIGLTAMLVIAFCFAYGDELLRTREKSSYDRINNAHRNDSPMIETGARSLRLPREVDKQQKTASAPLQRKTSPVEMGHGAIYSGSFQNDREPLEAFHG
jgi:hypothetical protein